MADSLLADKRLWTTTAERAVLTFAQTLAAELAVFGATDIEESRFAGLPWSAMLSVAGVAFVASVLTSTARGLSGSAGPAADPVPGAGEPVEEGFSANPPAASPATLALVDGEDPQEAPGAPGGKAPGKKTGGK